GAAPGRCPRGRPCFRLVRALRVAPRSPVARPLPRASEASDLVRRKPTVPRTRPASPPGVAYVALAEAARREGPTGRVCQTQGAARVAGGNALGRLARDASHPRIGIPRRALWLPNPPRDADHHLARSGQVSRGRAGDVVRAT